MLTLEVLSLSVHSLKHVCTIIYACEIWTKLYGPNYTKFWAYWQKTGFFKIPFDKELTTTFDNIPVAEIIV